jgi:CubicO group peptidase (beta-lactamase class C family)
MALRASLLLLASLVPGLAAAGPAEDALPFARLSGTGMTNSPIANAAFAPGADALPAPPFSGVLHLSSSMLRTLPAIARPVLEGRDARLFPGITLGFVTLGETLVPVERGEMVPETAPGSAPSYWRVIAQFGHVWHERADGEWSRAAFPLMLVNDTENHAHQGLATFLYKRNEISAVSVQFVQQTAPYLLSPHCVLWGSVPATVAVLDDKTIEATQNAARKELAARLPARPLSELRARLPKGALDGFGGPVLPKWQVALGLVYQGTLYFEALPTAYGEYPYPLEMRFGVRSVMKSVAVPLSLLHLAEVYGPYVLDLHIGDYVPGLVDPKWKRVRFIDAANMATGFGGTDTFNWHPNGAGDDHLNPHYDDWYTAPTSAEKIQWIQQHLVPSPWEPGTAMHYRDQDFHLLGIAIDAFLKKVRGPDADAWDMLRKEVLEPIGIAHAPTVRTREAGGRDGPAWFSAGYYPTLDDLAKIALLYLDHGQHDGKQILHRELTTQLMAATGALKEDISGSAGRVATDSQDTPPMLYEMGFHFRPFVGSRSQTRLYLPAMTGFGENEVVLFPNHIVAIRTAKVAEVPAGEQAASDDADATLRAVDRLSPF